MNCLKPTDILRISAALALWIGLLRTRLIKIPLASLYHALSSARVRSRHFS